jgi:hypothetical protein
MFVMNLIWAFPSDTTREELDHMILAKAPAIWKAFEEARAGRSPVLVGSYDSGEFLDAPAKVQ